MERTKNTYFQFKQFRVEQEGVAMKVCTDSCILGAYTNTDDNIQILDVGTGTGLLALMLAQKSGSFITAVEIDNVAAAIARTNFSNSKWKEKINLVNEDFKKFSQTSNVKFDLIISNPPFYKDYLKTIDSAKNTAMHSSDLTIYDLIEGVLKLLTSAGKFSVLLPVYESELLEKVCIDFGLYPIDKLIIRNNIHSPVIRIVTLYSLYKGNCSTNELVIRSEDGTYSQDFQNLLKEYYLIF